MSSLRLTVDCDETAHCDAGLPEDHSWIEHVLDAVSVVSTSYGRLRFRLAFEGDELLSDSLRRELHRLPSVRLGSYSIRTRTALVTFDPREVTPVEIAAAVLRGVREFARVHGECDLEHHHHDRKGEGHGHGEDCDHDHSSAPVTDASIRKELFKLALAGGALGYFVYKRLKTPVTLAAAASSPLSLATFVTIASGYPIFRDGYKSVAKKKKATDDTLIGIAVGASLLTGESLTGLSVVWLIQLGRILEMITLKRSRTAVKELMDLTPPEAWVLEEGTTVRAAVEDVAKGDLTRVFHGEKVALDGKIVRGKALVRESFLTGESIPREKTIGDVVYAGSVVEAGEIDVEVTSIVSDTVVATMIDAIENLRDNKAPIEKVGQRFASKFVPISIGISIATLLVTRDLKRAVTMLVIACPCAAGLATPTAVSAAIGQVARKGILIKGGAHLETAARVDTVIFDKTGTLTLGAPVLKDYLPTEAGLRLGDDEALRLAASAEQNTTHPLGRVLVTAAGARGLAIAPMTDYQLHEGMGIAATIEGRRVLIGNARLMAAHGIALTSSALAARPTLADEAEVDGPAASLLYLALDGELHGLYRVEDAVRPEAKAMLDGLAALGIKRFMMATGDNAATARYVAAQLGIAEVHAELLPGDKLALVESLKKAGRKVAMMGDGVNDAQALAQADLSIAMGASRCDVAIETSDVTIAREDLLLVTELFKVSRQTLRTIYQNFVAAVGINAGGMAYGAAGQLSPFAAALVHNASTIAVVLNSLRLGKAVAGKSQNPLALLKEISL